MRDRGRSTRQTILAAGDVGSGTLTSPHSPDMLSLPVTLLPDTNGSKVCSVKVPSQRDGRSMNRRPGQKGTVNVVGDNCVGRYWVDVPGSVNRRRKAVVLGSISEMRKPQAERKLFECIVREGINDSSILARSQSSIATFGQAAELWQKRQLLACGKSSSKSSMGCELQKHVLPLVKDKLIEAVNNYAVIRECIQIWQTEEREDGEISDTAASPSGISSDISVQSITSTGTKLRNTVNQPLASGSSNGRR